MAKQDFEFGLGRNPNLIPNDPFKKINENIIPKKPNFFDEPRKDFSFPLKDKPLTPSPLESSFKELLASVEAEKRYRLALIIASLDADIHGISEQRKHQIEDEVLGKK